MSLGMQTALQADADEFLRDHLEEQKKRRKSLSVSGEHPRPSNLAPPPHTTTSAPNTPISRPAVPVLPANAPPVPPLPTERRHSPTTTTITSSRNAGTSVPIHARTPSDALAASVPAAKVSALSLSSSPPAPSPSPPPPAPPPPPPVILPPKTIAFTEPDFPISKPPRAMSSIYGKRRGKITLPGDLGPNDPRRKKPPTSKSQSPSSRVPYLSTEAAGRRRASDIADSPHLRSSNDKDEKRALRLEKDLDQDAVDSSDDDADSVDSDDDIARARGRSKARSRSPDPPKPTQSDSEDSDTEKSGLDYLGPPRPSSSSSTAPTASSSSPAFSQSRSSSADATSPKITVTAPLTADYFAKQKRSVHPHSAFDHVRSNVSTPMPSDEEEHLSDVRRAQRLTLTISPIHSAPDAHRVIRQVIRGNYSYFQHEAEEGKRRQRVYLVATDLSPEAEYALEWTIGTILRDGDTLLALYAVDEEGGVPGSEGVEIGHGAEAVRDTATIVHSLPAEKVVPAPLRRAEPLSSKASEVVSQGKTKAELQRFQAAENISDRCVRLLRKTKLQVRVVVEVFHCKSPRHMITEVIDFLTPTLVILGSRGRSALKGVLLGSFSNYLVTKSSVPVMVARRRLKKTHKSKTHKDGLRVAGTGDGRMTYGRMSNVLEAPGGRKATFNRLAGAKVD